MKYTTAYTAALASVMLMAACESPVNDTYNVDNADAYTLVYTINAVSDASKNTLTFPLERDTTFKVFANLSSLRNPDKEIVVKFRTATELTDAYNEKNQTSYAAMPESCYSIDRLEAVIPAGQYTSSPVEITFNSKAFDGVGVFLLPLQIESVSPDIAVNPTLNTAYLKINGVYTENPFPIIDRSLWTIEDFSTEEQEPKEGIDYNGTAISIIDQSNDTFWGTQWRTAKPGPPHWITVDMGKTETVHGLRIRGRAVSWGSDNPKSSGNPRIFNIDMSDDHATWKRIGTFTVENRIENEIYFDHRSSGRYLRMTITATQADMYQASMADLKAF